MNQNFIVNMPPEASVSSKTVLRGNLQSSYRFEQDDAATSTVALCPEREENPSARRRVRRESVPSRVHESEPPRAIFFEKNSVAKRRSTSAPSRPSRDSAESRIRHHNKPAVDFPPRQAHVERTKEEDDDAAAKTGTRHFLQFAPSINESSNNAATEGTKAPRSINENILCLQHREHSLFHSDSTRKVNGTHSHCTSNDSFASLIDDLKLDAAANNQPRAKTLLSKSTITSVCSRIIRSSKKNYNGQMMDTSKGADATKESDPKRGPSKTSSDDFADYIEHWTWQSENITTIKGTLKMGRESSFRESKEPSRLTQGVRPSLARPKAKNVTDLRPVMEAKELDQNEKSLPFRRSFVVATKERGEERRRVAAARGA